MLVNALSGVAEAIGESALELSVLLEHAEGQVARFFMGVICYEGC